MTTSDTAPFVAPSFRQDFNMSEDEFLHLWQKRLIRADGTLPEGVFFTRPAIELQRLRSMECPCCKGRGSIAKDAELSPAGA